MVFKLENLDFVLVSATPEGKRAEKEQLMRKVENAKDTKEISPSMFQKTKHYIDAYSYITRKVNARNAEVLQAHLGDHTVDQLPTVRAVLASPPKPPEPRFVRMGPIHPKLSDWAKPLLLSGRQPETRHQTIYWDHGLREELAKIRNGSSWDYFHRFLRHRLLGRNDPFGQEGASARTSKRPSSAHAFHEREIRGLLDGYMSGNHDIVHLLITMRQDLTQEDIDSTAAFQEELLFVDETFSDFQRWLKLLIGVKQMSRLTHDERCRLGGPEKEDDDADDPYDSVPALPSFGARIQAIFREAATHNRILFNEELYRIMSEIDPISQADDRFMILRRWLREATCKAGPAQLVQVEVEDEPIQANIQQPRELSIGDLRRAFAHLTEDEYEAMRQGGPSMRQKIAIDQCNDAVMELFLSFPELLGQIWIIFLETLRITSIPRLASKWTARSVEPRVLPTMDQFGPDDRAKLVDDIRFVYPPGSETSSLDTAARTLLYRAVPYTIARGMSGSLLVARGTEKRVFETSHSNDVIRMRGKIRALLDKFIEEKGIEPALFELGLTGWRDEELEEALAAAPQSATYTPKYVMDPVVAPNGSFLDEIVASLANLFIARFSPLVSELLRADGTRCLVEELDLATSNLLSKTCLPASQITPSEIRDFVVVDYNRAVNIQSVKISVTHLRVSGDGLLPEHVCSVVATGLLAENIRYGGRQRGFHNENGIVEHEGLKKLIEFAQKTGLPNFENDRFLILGWDSTSTAVAARLADICDYVCPTEDNSIRSFAPHILRAELMEPLMQLVHKLGLCPPAIMPVDCSSCWEILTACLFLRPLLFRLLGGVVGEVSPKAICPLLSLLPLHPLQALLNGTTAESWLQMLCRAKIGRDLLQKPVDLCSVEAIPKINGYLLAGLPSIGEFAFRTGILPKLNRSTVRFGKRELWKSLEDVRLSEVRKELVFCVVEAGKVTLENPFARTKLSDRAEKMLKEHLVSVFGAEAMTDVGIFNFMCSPQTPGTIVSSLCRGAARLETMTRICQYCKLGNETPQVTASKWFRAGRVAEIQSSSASAARVETSSSSNSSALKSVYGIRHETSDTHNLPLVPIRIPRHYVDPVRDLNISKYTLGFNWDITALDKWEFFVVHSFEKYLFNHLSAWSTLLQDVVLRDRYLNEPRQSLIIGPMTEVLDSLRMSSHLKHGDEFAVRPIGKILLVHYIVKDRYVGVSVDGLRPSAPPAPNDPPEPVPEPGLLPEMVLDRSDKFKRFVYEKYICSAVEKGRIGLIPPDPPFGSS